MAITEGGQTDGGGGSTDPAKSRLYGNQIGAGNASAAIDQQNNAPGFLESIYASTLGDVNRLGGNGSAGILPFDSTGQTPGFGPRTPVNPPGSTDPGMGGMTDPFAGMFGGGSGGDYQGTPIGGAQGLNFLQPGAAEQFFNQVGGRFADPTMSEGYAKDVMGQYGGGNTPGVSNRADQAYQQFLSSTPADMSSYYTNAERQAQEQLDRTMAARGAYGSSAAADMSGEMLANMEADRAKAEAGYGLQRAGLGGQLGSAADVSSRGQSQNALNWMQGLQGVAGQSDTMGLNRLLGGMGAASAAQGAQTTRGQNMFNNQLNMGNALSGTMGEGYGAAFANDKDLFGQWLAGLTGMGAEQQGQATYNAQQQRADTKDFFNMLGNGSKFYQGIANSGT